MLLRYGIFLGISVIARAQTFTTLANLNGSNGSAPLASLVQGTDGNFYGTTSQGGSATTKAGTIFKITPAGMLTTLYSFTGGADGDRPQAGLLQATDGNFYGTTLDFAAGVGGTIFKITPGGMLTTLHDFSVADGALSEAGLLQATDGNIYGTTSSGGVNGDGTVFKITPAGTLTTLYSFTSGADGGAPLAGLIQAADGNFYGTTSAPNGTVFKITPGGALTTLYSFPGGTGGGRSPKAGLVQATDGNFYGTTSSGGAHGDGTVFKITPGGVLTILYSFAGPGAGDGSEPTAGLIHASDGNFYGTTELGGAHSEGTIFKLTLQGTLTLLYSFSGANDGSGPRAGLVEGTDGNLYGTTPNGGANNQGTVFRLQTMLPASSFGSTPTITLVQNAEGGASSIAPNTWVTLKGSNLAPAGDSRIWQASDFVNNQMPTQLDGVSVTLNGEEAYVYYISPAQINILTPPELASGPVQVQVTTSAGTSASFAAQAQAESPSFFIFGGGPYVAATHSDGSLIGPASLYPGQTTPAQPGETIVLYANGFGLTSPAVVSGSETQSGSLHPLPVVAVSGIPATVQFAGLISPGLFQFNVIVPASAPAGDNPIAATYDGLTRQSGVMVTVGR